MVQRAAAYLRNALRVCGLHALNKSRAELARDDAHARATAVTASVGGRAICVTLAEHVPYVVHLGDAAKVEVFQRDLQRQRNIRGASFLILASTTESKHGKNLCNGFIFFRA